MEKSRFPGQGLFDPINSTFVHKIILNNNKTLTGYSKGRYQNEMQDKVVLLERVILRLFKSGYLTKEKTSKIEFYRNSIANKFDRLVITLYPESFELGNDPQFILSERFISFINQLYRQISKNSIDTKVLMQKPVYKDEKGIFDLNKKRFNNERELLKFIHDKQREGYESAQVLSFYHEYKLRYL